MIVRSKAPLRLGFAGGGTDVSPYSDCFGGAVLNATINLYAYCTIESNKEDKIEFNMADANKKKIIGLVRKIDTGDEFALLTGVYNRVVKDYNDNKPLPIIMTTYADAPPGSGLGTSSTMVVAILSAFIEYLNIPLGEYDVASLAYDIERNDIGLKGGKQDQYAATFGGVNYMEFYEDNRVIINPLRVKKWILDELEASLVLYYTGTSRDSGKIIFEQIKGTTNNNEKSLNALHHLKSMAINMKEYLLKGDIKNFAETLKSSWEEKKKTSDVVTNTVIDAVYDCAISNGAIAAKVSGAGGGGFMMIIVPPTRKLDVVNALSNLGGKVVSANFTKYGVTTWKVD